MDFFEYASIAALFSHTGWVQYLIGGLCFAIVFIFEAIALYTIAMRNGYKNKWMAFVPFINTYYIGVCSQKNKFYNISTKTIGLIAAIFELVIVSLYIFDEITFNILLNNDYLFIDVETTYLGTIETYAISSQIPQNMQWAAWVFNYLNNYIIRILNILYLILDIILLICFFQTYACRRYVLFAITSVIFPIMGILFFIVRNNKGVNYKDYMRAEHARQYQQYQQYRQQNYNNPYNQNYGQNPYDRNSYNNPSAGGSGADPFNDSGLNGNAGSNSSGAPQGDPFEDFDK